MQVIVVTSDKYAWLFKGFWYQWSNYFGIEANLILCGLSNPPDIDPKFGTHRCPFYSAGSPADYPPSRWSDKLIKILDEVAEEVFILMLEDYWLTRPVDTRAVRMIYDYMFQFENVIKFDLTTDRLFADGGGKYLYGYNTYETLGYLDLIKSEFSSPYHLSLWGGMWRRDLLRRFLVRGETAQQIELNGTHRLAQVGDELLVLGTRQAPIKHANVFQRGGWNDDPMTGLPALKAADREELKRLGYIS